jgi:hypothetical protein
MNVWIIGGSFVDHLWRTIGFLGTKGNEVDSLDGGSAVMLCGVESVSL